MLVSAVQQHELAKYIHISPLTPPAIPALQVFTEHQAVYLQCIPISEGTKYSFAADFVADSQFIAMLNSDLVTNECLDKIQIHAQQDTPSHFLWSQRWFHSSPIFGLWTPFLFLPLPHSLTVSCPRTHRALLQKPQPLLGTGFLPPSFQCLVTRKSVQTLK